MQHMIKHEFNTTPIRATSPFDKNTLANIYTTIRDTCNERFPSYKFIASEITIKFVNESSSYTLEEFDKYFSNSFEYTKMSFSITYLPRKLFLVFVISPSSIFVSLESDELTKPQLEDFMVIIIAKITRFIEQGKKLQPIHTELHNELDYMIEKVHTLPVTDKAGNLLEEEPVQESHVKSTRLYNAPNTVNERYHANAETPSNAKTPFYKSTTFWAAMAVIVPAIFWLADHFLPIILNAMHP